MPPIVVADVGSCHSGRRDGVMEAVKIAKDIGIDILKFQLFHGEEFTKNGNIEFPRECWGELIDRAREVGQVFTASAFDWSAVALLNGTKDLPFIKFAYSQRFRTDFHKGSRHKLMISCDVLSHRQMPKDAIKLYCIPEYPVRYEVCFDELFPWFDGFSDHTLGYKQTIRAAQAGAKYIEKHMRLWTPSPCPDEAFALHPKEFDKMLTALRSC